MSDSIEAVSASSAAAIRDGGGLPGGLSWADGAPSAIDLVALEIAAEGVPTWIVVEDGVVLGMLGLHGPIVDGAPVEIGYHVAASQRGRGVGSRAVGELLALLEAAGVAEVIAEVDLGDPWAESSSRLLTATGFLPVAAAASLPGSARFHLRLR